MTEYGLKASAATSELEEFRGYLLVLARNLVRASGRLKRKLDASDIVQETLAQAHVALPGFKGSTQAELAGWLRAILASKFADAARYYSRGKRDAALEQSFRETLDTSAVRFGEIVPTDETSPTKAVWKLERARLLARALEELPADQKIAVELHHVAGYSVSEIGSHMGRSNPAVAGLLRRGLQRLRASLSESELE